MFCSCPIYMAMKKAIRPKLGRPRKFDEETAVEAAMLVFWEKGYEEPHSATLPRPWASTARACTSVLATRKLYNTTHLAFVPVAFAKPTLREFVDYFLNTAIRFWVDRSHPGTCMTIQNLAVSEEAQPIRQAMAGWRKWRMNTVRDRIERARKAGDLPPDVKPDTFARYLSVIMAGLAVHAASGATLSELKRTIAMFRQTMPIPMD